MSLFDKFRIHRLFWAKGKVPLKHTKDWHSRLAPVQSEKHVITLRRSGALAKKHSFIVSSGLIEVIFTMRFMVLDLMILSK